MKDRDPAVRLLAVDDLSVGFETDNRFLTAVDRISFHVSPGETLGIVGESGSGKTVTAKAILGLLPRPQGVVTSGSIKLRGDELVGASERTMRAVRGARVAMIFQEPMTALNPVLTIGYQIMEAIGAHRTISRQERRRMAIEMLERVRIPSPELRVDEYPHQLSGGMRQRVIIAMALCLDPEILIADEPTTALDVTVQAQILALIAELQRERGLAVLLITHDLGVVAEVCDRLLVMYAGQIVEEGRVEDVFCRPLHPYTAGLLSCAMPLRDRSKHDRRLRAIPGNVPHLGQLPIACRFQDRCERSEHRCTIEPPMLLRHAPDVIRHAPAGERRVRCHFPVPEGEA